MPESRDIDTQCSAPGKLYLFGEYAVLAGSWSVAAAVDRRVRVERFKSAGEYRVRGADFDGSQLVECVLEEAGRVVDHDWRPGHFAADVTELYEHGVKLGLGSSAASAVALASAALADGEGAEVDSPEFRGRVLEVAEAAHAAFQGGRGSGGGVAAASFGGVLAFRRGSPTRGFSQLQDLAEFESARSVADYDIETLGLPDGVRIEAIWLGEPASTTSFVDGVVRQMRTAPAPVYRVLRRIGALAEEAMGALREGSSSRLIEAAEEGDRAMEELGELCGLPIIVDRHRKLREAAVRASAVAKPSGAGGGDFSLVFGNESTDWERLLGGLPSGAEHVGLGFGAPGVRRES